MVKDLCFEIIETCLNNCKFCSSNSDCHKSKIISFEDFKRTIDHFMKDGGIEELSISGGEPFLHPELLEMVKYAKSLNIRTVIFSSGVCRSKKLTQEQENYLINEMNKKLDEINKYEPWNERLKNNVKNYYMKYLKPEQYDAIDRSVLQELKDIGLDKIVFDMQAYEEETDKVLMGRDAVSRCALLDSLLNASFVGLDIDVHFIPMKPNYREIGDILELLEIPKIGNISLLNFVPQGRGRKNKEDLMLNEEELKEFFKLLDDCKHYFSGNIRVGIPLQEGNQHKCNAGLEKIDIKFDGTVLPCPAFKDISEEDCRKYGIKLYNIYEDLESIKIVGKGTRVEPLCRKVYKRGE